MLSDIQCGNNFVMVLTKDGKVYEWVNANRPKQHKDFGESGKIIQMAAGTGHSAAVTSIGEVFCWGTSHVGQVGNNSFEMQREPVKVFPVAGMTDDTKIVAVACGMSSTFAVAEGGNVRISVSFQ